DRSAYRRLQRKAEVQRAGSGSGRMTRTHDFLRNCYPDMNVNDIAPGVNPPDDFNAIIEIPLAGPPVKYEVDKGTGGIHVNRLLATAMRYPCNYGFVPNTLAEDGDPLDVMVLISVPLLPGSIIRCRPIGYL